MSKRYTYSRTITTREGAETFSAVEFDSFDEAKNVVDRGIRDRRLELGEEKEKVIDHPHQASGPVPAPKATVPNTHEGDAPSQSTTGPSNQG